MSPRNRQFGNADRITITIAIIGFLGVIILFTQAKIQANEAAQQQKTAVAIATLAAQQRATAIANATLAAQQQTTAIANTTLTAQQQQAIEIANATIAAQQQQATAIANIKRGTSVALTYTASALLGSFFPQSPEELITYYFQAVTSQRNYEHLWELQSSEYKASHSNNYESYARFWEDIDATKIESLSFYDRTKDTAHVKVSYVISKNGQDTLIDADYYLIYDGNLKSWRFAAPYELPPTNAQTITHTPQPT